MMTILIMAVPLSLIPLGNSLHAVTTCAVITSDSVVWAPPGSVLYFCVLMLVSHILVSLRISGLIDILLLICIYLYN